MYETCRICEKEDETVTEEVRDYQEKLKTLTQLEFHLKPDLPSKICEECVQDLLSAVAFRERCRTREIKLRQQVANVQCGSSSLIPRCVSPESMFLVTLGESLKQKNRDRFTRLPDLETVHEVIEKNKKRFKPKYDKKLNLDIDAIEADFTRCDRLEEPKERSIPPPRLPNEGPYECELCKFIYNTKKQFNQHWNIKHRHPDRKYICGQCGKMYRKTDTYKDHLNSHMAVLPFACDICGARFARKVGVRQHMMVHTGQKHHLCPYCPKQFGFPTDLQRHLTSHTGIYIYSCQFCGKGFNRKKVCLAHEERKCSISVPVLKVEGKFNS